MNIKNQNAGNISLALLGVLFVGLLAGFIIVASNFSNRVVDAGYAAYVVQKPIFGKSTYQGVLIGPDSTGFKWRFSATMVSITPYTYSETFDGLASVIALDKLPLTANGHIVWRLRSDEASVKKFIEQYGGLYGNDITPDKIAIESYSNYIKEPFRTLIREEVAKYNGLDVNEKLAAMGVNIQQALQEKLAQTPFEVIQVVMGNAQPPQSVLNEVSAKVAKAQELARKPTELQIANQNAEIEKANGT